MTKPRKGQAPAFPMPREEFGRRFRAQLLRPGFEKESEAIARLEAIAWDAYEKDRKAPRTSKAGPGFADPRIQALRRVARHARQAHRGAEAAAGSGDALARARDLRLVAQRRLLSRGDVEDLPPREDRAGDARRRGTGGGPAGSEPPHLRLRAAHLSVQGLRVHRAAAVPLAVLLLSQPRASTRWATGWRRSTSAGSRRTA